MLPPLPGPGGKFVSPTFTVICSGFKTEHFRRDDGDDGFGAGADVLHAEAELDAAVGIDLRFALGVCGWGRRRATRRPRSRCRFSPTPGELPGFWYFSFQPNFSAPILYSRWRTSLGSFFSRNSSGSMPSFTARSSMADSMPKDAGGFPGARKARAEPALTATCDCFTRVFGTG